MLGLIRKYPLAFLFAVLVHAAASVLLVLSFDWTPRPPLPEELQVLQAVAVDERQVQAEMEKIRRIEDRKHQSEQERVRKVEEQVQQEKDRLAELEAQRKHNMERQKKAEAERLKAEQQQAEAQRLAEESRREASKLMDKQRKLEDAQQRKRQLEEEAKRLEQQRSSQVKGEVDKYTRLVRERVEQKWMRPVNWKQGAKCVVSVRVIPGGDVVDARIVKSCGDSLSDRSVETAVRQAAPLPVPSDPQAFAQFRSFTFTFNPDEK
ncbi:MAG: cell envelope integrity protein TolA [Gammaproteobacteria bacterium]|nr:cell envelope integrity protein TolA [Gammaproteobacteria bacterium]